MKAALVRIGIDQAYGKWNAPVCPDSKHFVYVPIPEQPENPNRIETQFQPGLARSFNEFTPPLQDFCGTRNLDMSIDLKFPAELLERKVHLDPDFSFLTYGDEGARRGARMADMKDGDLLAFYAGLKPIAKCQHKLVYALIGLFVVKEVVRADDIPMQRWQENAHTRKLKRGTADIVVRAKPELSGRLKTCLPIGEYRDRAYRVTKDLLDAWGGLSVEDGFIQRSAVPPLFSDPNRFYQWFLKQNIPLLNRNN
jgi:hypothetical protein